MLSSRADFGETGRDLDVEGLRWLITGPSPDNPLATSNNRPTLLQPGGYIVDEDLAHNAFGFRCAYLDDEILDKVNSTKLEAAFHRRFHGLPLGRRLWRGIGCGSNGYRNGRDSVHKVFIAYSWKVSSEVAAGRLVINH